MMNKSNRSNFWHMKINIYLLFIIFFLVSSCIHTPEKKLSNPKDDIAKTSTPVLTKENIENTKITDVYTTQDNEGLTVWIKGNNHLEYSSFKRPVPLAITFLFPKTSLKNVKIVHPIDNEVFSKIQTSELKEEKTESQTARIDILLKKESVYKAESNGDTVKVLFKEISGKDSVSSSKGDTQKSKVDNFNTQPAQENLLPATFLEGINTTPSNSGIAIDVKANGTIKDYKSFTIENPLPCRIVYDLFNLKSQHKKEQSFQVNSKWVQNIRYFAYPNKIRLVVETKKAYIASFSEQSVEKGLSISIGENIKHLSQKQNYDSDKQSKTVSVSKQSAVLNRIEFVSEEEGKSTVIIGTTRPVEYIIKKGSDKRLNLQLFNTKIPNYRKRPLITTRFESAVDRILPIQTQEMLNNSLVTMEMRELVPYMVEQIDNKVLVHFEPSSIPPKSDKEIKLPQWKDVLTKASQETEKETEEKISKKPKDQKIVEEEILSPDSSVKYTGEKIALDFYETDIKNVFRLLKQISGKNFAIDKDVNGKVTMSLEKPVPWDQVLDLILKMNQLGKINEGDIIRITTIGTLNNEKALEISAKEAMQQAKNKEKNLEPLTTQYIPISYSDASGDVLPHLDKITTKDRGTLSVDKRTNTIIMTDTPEKIKQAKEIVFNLDQPTRQVLIEAKIVEASTTLSRQIGTSWGDSYGGIPNNLSTTNTNPLAGVGPQRGYDVLGGTYDYTFAANLASGNPLAVGLSFMRSVGSPLVLNAQLVAMESVGKGKIISAPKILTLDNKAATIKQGLEIPYTVTDPKTGSASTSFKNADLLLNVTPHITTDNRVSMKISVTKNEKAGETATGVPYIGTKEANTELLVNDGDTIVIGGIIKNNKTSGSVGIPGLSKIPFLGLLFKANSTSEDKSELLIFITPTVVQLEQKKNF